MDIFIRTRSTSTRLPVESLIVNLYAWAVVSPVFGVSSIETVRSSRNGLEDGFDPRLQPASRIIIIAMIAVVVHFIRLFFIVIIPLANHVSMNHLS